MKDSLEICWLLIYGGEYCKGSLKRATLVAQEGGRRDTTGRLVKP